MKKSRGLTTEKVQLIVRCTGEREEKKAALPFLAIG